MPGTGKNGDCTLTGRTARQDGINVTIDSDGDVPKHNVCADMRTNNGPGPSTKPVKNSSAEVAEEDNPDDDRKFRPDVVVNYCTRKLVNNDSDNDGSFEAAFPDARTCGLGQQKRKLRKTGAHQKRAVQRKTKASTGTSKPKK